MKVRNFTRIREKTGWLLLGLLAGLLLLPLLSFSTPVVQDKISLEEAFHRIGEKYDVFFNYDRSIAANITVDYEENQHHSLDDAMEYVLKNTNLGYRIFDERFVVVFQNNDQGIASLKEMIGHVQGFVDERETAKKRNTKPVEQLRTLSANELYNKRLVFSVSGTVTDDSGEPLIGVNIQVKGTNKGTATNFEGRFALEDIDESAVLVVSYVGYQTQEVEVSGRSGITVTMVEDLQTLDEVVVVGYGTQKKINLTGSVDVISNDMLKDRHASTVSRLLIGTTPGLNFDFDKNGYQPGAKASVDIRGIGSLNGGRPYILIDGFPGNMNSLNPEDIESISVLKDAAASAIYGARAPFGVVLITTKSGKHNTKLSVNYSGSMDIVTPAKLPGTLDSYTYARVINEAALNKSSSLYYDESIIDRIIAYQNDDFDFIRSQFPSDFPADEVTNWSAFPAPGGGWATSTTGHANNDFWDLAMAPNLGQFHNLSIQGGSENTAYYLSAGFTNQASSIVWGSDYNNRYNLSAKLNTSLTDWWDLKYEGRFMKNYRYFPNGGRDNKSSYNRLFQDVYNTSPLQSLYSSFGDQTRANVKNAFVSGSSDDETAENWQILGTELRPLKRWKINVDFAYQSTDFYGLHDGKKFYEINWLTGEKGPPKGPSLVNEYHSSNYYWSSNIYTSYDWNINSNHNFRVMAGGQYEAAKSRSLNGQARNLIVPDIISLSTATGDPSLNERLSHWATEGYFGRLTYNYKGRYLLESNMRYDGTSRFLAGKQWGFFPSFSAGWVISNEDFWPDAPTVLNTLKFRGSWGQLGNQNVPAYQDLALIQLSNGSVNWWPGFNKPKEMGYTLTPSLVSPVLTWETAATTNFGVDMELFNNKLGVNFDWFERNTTDMIGPSEALPGVLGASAPRSNNSALRTRGWELSMKWKQYVNSGFNYFVGVNLYDSKAVITQYNNPTGYLGSWVVGQEVGDIWGWSSHGLFQTQQEIENHADQSFIFNIWNTGDVKYDDLNGDGKIDNGQNTIDDHGDLMLLGNSSPHYQFGINLGASFKGIDFSMLWKGIAKRDKAMTRDDYAYYGFYRSGWSQPKWDHLDYYRDAQGTSYVGLHEGEANINKDAFYPRPYLDRESSSKNQTSNSRYLGNFAYLRLQDIQLGYSINNNLFSRIGLNKVRIYLSGSNILTLDHLPVGMDPTLPGGGYVNSTGKDYRADRIYSFGLNISY